MSQLAEVPSQVQIKKPLKDKFRTTHDIHRPAVKMGKCQKLTYLQMASSNPVPCRGIIQTVVFVGIYWTGYGGCTQPAWPPFGVTNTNTIFNKYTCGVFENMNTVYHNIHLHRTPLLLRHWYEIMALYYVKSILTEISASRQGRRVLQKSKIIRIKFLSIWGMLQTSGYV